MSGLRTERSARLGASLLAAGLVLVAQLVLVAVAGTDIPFHDQWDVEGRGLYPAMREGGASVAAAFAPHNEHRIVWTHLLNRGLFAANGQWDPLVQLVAGAGLHAVVAGCLAWFLTVGLGARFVWLVGAGVTLLSLPLAGWHNALWGFQSQVYFAVGFAVIGFGLLTSRETTLGTTLAGWLAVAASLLAMGPGLLVPVALAGLWLWRRREGTATWLQLVPAGALVLVAWALHTPVEAHDALRPASPINFLEALGRLLAWPHTGQPWAAWVMNLPVAVVLGRRWLTKRTQGGGEDFVLLVAGWGWLVAAGAAWSRGGSEEFAAGVPSRYADFLLLLPLANFWSAVVLAREASRRGRWLAGAWAVFVFAGWLGLSAEVWRGIVQPRARDREAPARLVRDFQMTGNSAVFAGQPRLLVPHPNPESVRAVLTDLRLQGALPPSLQPERPPGPLSRGVRTLLGR